MKNPKQLLLLFILLIIALKATAQTDTTFIDSTWHKIARSKASFYKIDTKIPGDSTRLITRSYNMKGQLQHEIPILIIYDKKTHKKKKVWDGLCKEWDENGTLKLEIEYRLNKMNGVCISYWKNGHVKRKEKFVDNISKGGECYNDAGKKIPFSSYYTLPEYKGGLPALFEFIDLNRRYKQSEENSQNPDYVTVQFIVTKMGTIKDLRVTRSLSKAYDQDALRVIALTKNWIPAMVDGEPIDRQYGVDVPF